MNWVLRLFSYCLKLQSGNCLTVMDADFKQQKDANIFNGLGTAIPKPLHR